MRFPNWFKILWWLLLLLLVGVLLLFRLRDIAAGQGTSLDFLLIVLWVVLALAPIFSEISFGLLRVRQEVDAVRDEMRRHVSALQSIVSANAVAQANPQVTVNIPPSDANLPSIESKIREVLEERFDSKQLEARQPKPEELRLPEGLESLFAARRNIEKSVRRIVEARGDCVVPTHASMTQLLGLLRHTEVDYRLIGAIRDIYAICSAAIHGREVTAAQRDFVTREATKIIAVLRQMADEKAGRAD